MDTNPASITASESALEYSVPLPATDPDWRTPFYTQKDMEQEFERGREFERKSAK